MSSQSLPRETSEEETREMEDSAGGGGGGWDTGSCISQPPSGDCCLPCSPPGWVAVTQGVWRRLPRPFSVDGQLTEKWASYGFMPTPPHPGSFWALCHVGPLHGTWGPLMPAYCREWGEGWLGAGGGAVRGALLAA